MSIRFYIHHIDAHSRLQMKSHTHTMQKTKSTTKADHTSLAIIVMANKASYTDSYKQSDGERKTFHQ